MNDTLKIERFICIEDFINERNSSFTKGRIYDVYKYIAYRGNKPVKIVTFYDMVRDMWIYGTSEGELKKHFMDITLYNRKKKIKELLNGTNKNK